MTMMEIPTFNLFSRLRASLRPDLHFHSLHLDAPGCSRLIKNSLQFNNLVKTFFFVLFFVSEICFNYKCAEGHLHCNGDTLSVAENFMQILGSQNVSQRGLSKKSETSGECSMLTSVRKFFLISKFSVDSQDPVVDVVKKFVLLE